MSMFIVGRARPQRYTNAAPVEVELHADQQVVVVVVVVAVVVGGVGVGVGVGVVGSFVAASRRVRSSAIRTGRH